MTIEPRTTDVLTTCVVIVRSRVRLPRPFASECADEGLRPREAGRETVGGVGQRRSVGAERQPIVAAKSKERISGEVRVALQPGLPVQRCLASNAQILTDQWFNAGQLVRCDVPSSLDFEVAGGLAVPVAQH